MFIDFVTLLLINMVAGLALLACYVWKGFDDPDQKRWAPAFAVPGFIALVNGTYMTWTWPLPGPYSSAFGETSIMLGVLFLGASFALARGWDLTVLAVYGIFAGAAAMLIGVRIIDLGLTRDPALSGVGFILTGLCGVCAAPALRLSSSKAVRLAGVLVLSLAALIWAFTGYLAYWGHMESFSEWVPTLMRSAGASAGGG